MRPYDQIPRERLAVGDLATPLDEELGLPNVHLAVWMAGDDSKADASATRAGNQVMDSIDAMLRQLHLVRARMVAERREDQDIAAARTDELLAARKDAADIIAPQPEEPAACPDHRPVLDSAVGWYCPACGSDASPDGAS